MSLASTYASAFIGRAADLEAITGLFRQGRRLVTLQGTAGVGKTRLAYEWAAAVPRSGFCELAAAWTEEQLVDAVAAALGVPLPEGSLATGVQRIGHALAARGELTLVLDNFEQLAPGASGLLAGWLGQARQLRALVTSRRALEIDGEARYDVPHLELSSAVSLLEDRARLVRPEFDATSDLEPVRRIVETLDGNPLAIELAAARIALMSPQELLRRLSDRFAVLRRRPRVVTSRHDALQTAIDWSWTLLAEHERIALAQCSVFQGGFSLPAAEAVVRLEAGAPPVAEVLDSIAAQSMVRALAPAGSGETRLTLDESTRDYAGRALSAREGEPMATARRHAAYYLAHVEGWAAAARSVDGRAARERLARERDNVMAAHGTLRSHDPEAATQLIVALWSELGQTATFSQSRPFLDCALADARRAGVPQLTARVLCARADAARRELEADDARIAFQEALDLARAAGDPHLEVEALCGLAYVSRSPYAEREPLYIEAMAIAERSSNVLGGARVRSEMARVLWFHGRIAEARAHWEEALRRFTQERNEFFQIQVLTNLGLTGVDLDRPDEAELDLERALALARRAGRPREEGYALGILSYLRLLQGRLAEARIGCSEALAVHRAIGETVSVAPWQCALGTIALGQGDLDGARTFLSEGIAGLGQQPGRPDGRRAGYLAFLAVTEALARDLPAAGRHIDQARLEVAGTSGRPLVETLGVLVDVSLEERTAPRQRRPGARSRGAAARGRLVSAEASLREHPSGLLRHAIRMVRAALDHPGDKRRASPAAPTKSAPPATALRVAPDGSWFEHGASHRVELGHRAALQGILQRLLRERMLEPGQGLDIATLQQAGWPRERTVGRTGAARVYVALATLRKLGLREVLLRGARGYLLDPGVDVSIDPGPA